MSKLSIRDLDLKGKRVFIRVDFNVPLSDGSPRQVEDDTRIRESLPTLKFAMEKGARLVLASHLGRPRGKVKAEFSLVPVAAKLADLLGRPVEFAKDCTGTETEAKSKGLKEGSVLLVENVRFHPEEEKNDEAFSRQLAALCDGLFVCDAFGSAHRAHASVVGITRFVRKSAAGFLMEKELKHLGQLLEKPEKPFVTILGGAKVSDKIDVVQNLMKVADVMLIGGAMAYTFLKAEGKPVGKSLVEEDKLDLANKLLAEAMSRNFKLVLPADHVLGRDVKQETEMRVSSIEDTPTDMMGLDIGPKTIANYRNEISKARTIFWNGPMGVFEIETFARGTLEVARAVAEATGKGATSVIGGGDSVSAVQQSGVADQITHISTGGGASLEFLSGQKLPGVEALTDK